MLFLFYQPGFDVKRLRAVKARRMAYCRLIAPALFGQHMHKHRPVYPGCFLEHRRHFIDVVPVYRAKIEDSHIFKQHARYQQLLYPAFGSADFANQPLAVHGYFMQRFQNAVFQILVYTCGTDAAQILAQAADISGNGHIIII